MGQHNYHRGGKRLEDVGSQLVLALEHSYNSIRRLHPDVPEAVIVISSAEGKYGHFASSRWTVEGTSLPEIMVSAEGLRRPPREVLATLVHEAAHGLAHVRGIQETSDSGRFHNRKFAKLAEELGMEVSEHGHKRNGLATTVLPEEAHPELVDALAPKLVAYREFEVVTKPPPRRSREVSLRCLCPRTIRVFPSVWETGSILCAVCESEFDTDGGRIP